MTEPTPHEAPKAKKGDRRKQTIIAGASIAGVVLTIILIKRSSAASTDTSGGGVAGSTDSSLQDALASNSEALSGVQNGLSYLTNALTGDDTTTTTTTPPPATTTTTKPTLSDQITSALNHVKGIVANDTKHATGATKTEYSQEALGAQSVATAYNPNLSPDQNITHIQAIIKNDSVHKLYAQERGAEQALAAIQPLHAAQAAQTTATAK